MHIVHRFLGIITILLGIILMLTAVVLPGGYTMLANFFSNAGTTLLVAGFFEIVFKTFLQSTLITETVAKFKKAISQPFDATYLKREDVPSEKDITQLLKQTRSVIYLKSISMTGAVGVGLLYKIFDVVKSNRNIKINILLLDPASPVFEHVAKLASLDPEKMKRDIEHVTHEVEKFNNTSVQCKLYTSFPTCGMICVDPKTEHGLLRIEPYLFNGQSAAHRINLFLSRKQDARYFDEVYRALENEWGSSR